MSDDTASDGRLDFDLDRKLVLVVDDDPDLREFVRLVLESADYRVRLAADGAQALRLLTEEAPDVILLDIKMPGLSGDDLLRLFQRLQRHPPVVIMTAADRARDRALSFRNPFYLAKPFDAPLLLATVATAQEGVAGETPSDELDS